MTEQDTRGELIRASTLLDLGRPGEASARLGAVLAAEPGNAFALRLLLGEMADALLLSGQRVVPARAEEGGYRFVYPTLEPALEAALVTGGT